jgi:hypothetical protein
MKRSVEEDVVNGVICTPIEDALLKSQQRIHTASVASIRPLLLDSVPIEHLSLPGADISNLPIRVIVPSDPKMRVRDRLTQLV